MIIKYMLKAMMEDSSCLIKQFVFIVLSVIMILCFVWAFIPEYICYWPQIVLLGVIIFCFLFAVWFISLDF